jgi:hypothetical protein
LNRERLEYYKSLLVQLVPENEQQPRPTTANHLLTRSQSAALGIGLAVVVFAFISPWPIGEAEETEWVWKVGMLAIWGVLGAIVASRICFLIGFYRRVKELNRAPSKAEQNKVLLWHCDELIPYSPVGILLMTSAAAVGSLYFLQQCGWDTVIFSTVAGPISLFFCELAAELWIIDLLPHRDLFLDALEASGKRSMLMGESARFPTENEHKRSEKFK